MNSERFIAYVGDPELHDGTISAVREHPGRLMVEVRGEFGRVISVEFTGVHSIRSNRPLGMILYSLSEMETQGPGRRFIFVNCDEKDDASLEVQSEDFSISRKEG